MDQKADFSDKQTNMDNGSKNACSQSMDVVTQPPHTNTEIQRSEYHQAQADSASTVDDESFQSISPKEMDRLDKNRWSPNDLEIFQHPMWLISAVSEKNEAGKQTKILLKSEEKVFDQISKIDWPIVVVAVAGLYKTGKSYLMNRLAESSKGFEVGDTIERTTKGIWAWCKVHPTLPNTVLLLLDTEGLGDPEKGDTSHDNKIFTLATLLCNCLVYNIMGALDFDTISKLTFVTEMASTIRFRGQSSEDNHAIQLILPDFVLCLRDFRLQLMKDGKQITENDYLEQNLAENEGQAEQFNKPRECIKKYFTRRECFAFPVPRGGNEDLWNLEKLSFTDLSPKFQKVTTRFLSYIYKIPPKELLASKPLNGQMFVTLADRYVTAIKHGAVPDVDDAFKAVSKKENAKIEKEAVEIFKDEMKEDMLPVSEKTLRKRYTNAQKIALDHLRHNVIHDFESKCEIQAQRKMDAIWDNMNEINEKKVREKCENTLQNVFEKYLEKNLENQEYEKADGHRRYKRDVESTKEKYVSALRDFEQNEILSTWYRFLETKTKAEARIVEADENMSQKEKEAEQIRNQEKIEELLKQQQKAYEDKVDKQQQYLEDHYEKLDKDRCEQQIANNERYIALVKEKLEKEAAQREVERYKIAQEAVEKQAARYKKEHKDALEEKARYKKEAARLKTEQDERKKKWMPSRVLDAIQNK